MLTLHLETNTTGRRVSILDLFTTDRQLFKADGAPTKMYIPLPAGANGTTLMFYLRSNIGITGGGYSGLLSGPPNTYAWTMYNYEFGPAWKAYANGDPIGATPGNKNQAGVWTRWALVSKPGYENRAAGNLYINADESFGSGPANVDWADIRVFDRVLSAAEIVATLPPNNMMGHYTFANQATQGTSVPDQMGNLGPGVLVY